MENILLAFKYVLFYAMELIVLTIVGVTLLAGLYQFLRRRIRAIQKGPFPERKSPLPIVSTQDWPSRQ